MGITSRHCQPWDSSHDQSIQRTSAEVNEMYGFALLLVAACGADEGLRAKFRLVYGKVVWIVGAKTTPLDQLSVANRGDSDLAPNTRREVHQIVRRCGETLLYGQRAQRTDNATGWEPVGTNRLIDQARNGRMWKWLTRLLRWPVAFAGCLSVLLPSKLQT